MRRVMVTGAAGFIGGHIVAGLKRLGVEVVGVDLLGDGQRIVSGDVAVPGAWQQAAAGCDVVIHTAALVSFRAGLHEFHRVNVVGTHNALQAAIAAGAERFVQLSSVTVFGNDFPDGVQETAPVRPLGVPYVDTKIAGEQLVLQAHAEGRANVTVVRPGDVYGPGSRPWVILPLREIRRGRMVLPLGGRGIHSPVHVGDLVDGIIAAADAPQAAGQVLTLSGPRGVTNRDYFGALAALEGRRVRSAPAPLLFAAAQLAARLDPQGELTPATIAYLMRKGTYSSERARKLIGYVPKVDLDEGIEDCRRWLTAQGMLTPAR